MSNTDIKKFDDESLKEIGRVTLNYSALEFILCVSIWKLLNVEDDKGRVVTSGLAFNVLLTMFGGLCHSAFDGMTITLANKCIKSIEDVSLRRNQLIHSTLVSADDGTFGAFKYRSKGISGVKKSFTNLDEKSLKKLADDINETKNELSKFYGMFLHS